MPPVGDDHFEARIDEVDDEEPSEARAIKRQFWFGNSRSIKTLTATAKPSSSSPESTAQEKSR
jgi:hypothetical protein